MRVSQGKEKKKKSCDVIVSVDPQRAADEKVAKHGIACQRLGHKFVPYVIGIDGELHVSTKQFLAEVGRHMPSSTATIMTYYAQKAAIEAWASGTIAMIRNVLAYAKGHSSGVLPLTDAIANDASVSTYIPIPDAVPHSTSAL